MLCKNTSLRQQKAQRYLLNSPPTIADFHHFLDIAVNRKGCWIDFSWRVNEQLFTIGLVFNEVLSSPVWKLYRGTETRSLIWEHQSCDIPLVFNLVAMHTNMDESTVRADGAMCSVKLDKNTASTQDTLYSFQPAPKAEESPETITKSMAGTVVQLPDAAKSKPSKEKATDDSPKKEVWSPAPALPQLISAETGLLTYPGFLLMLEREYYLAWRANRSLAILIFSIECRQLSQVAAQAGKLAIKEHLARIMKIKRKYDVFAHYKGDHFAFILPQTTVTGAKAIARRIAKALETKANPFAESLTCAFGAADVRGDGKTLSMVLMAAEEARRSAEEVGPKILTYRDLLISKDPEEQERFRQQCILANLNHSVYGSLVENLKTELSSAKTGVFTLPMFYHFLEHDYRRAVRENQSVSLLTFSVKFDPQKVTAGSPEEVLLARDILAYVTKIKRRTDVLSEYQNGQFALILPDTPTSGAKALAKRISSIIEQGQTFASSPSGPVGLDFSVVDAMRDYANLLHASA